MSSGDFKHVGSPGAVAHRILLIEDEPETASFIKEYLEHRRYRVDIAKDGGQAQATFMMRKPDFVILDLILPGESGFEVCERLKQHEENVPVLILTAIDMQDSRDLAQRVGADGYLTKPFDPDELVDQIETISGRAWERVHRTQPERDKRIRFTCRCGKKFRVSPVHRGRTMTCPECGEPLVVPRHA